MRERDEDMKRIKGRKRVKDEDTTETTYVEFQRTFQLIGILYIT
jgi:hypothetical protein